MFTSRGSPIASFVFYNMLGAAMPSLTITNSQRRLAVGDSNVKVLKAVPYSFTGEL